MTAPRERTGDSERRETPSQRADRNFLELVQELRVAQTGVQILFGFLLAVAFTTTFPLDDRGYVVVLTIAVLMSFGSAVCFTAPVVFHRIHFRQGRKEDVVWVGQWMSLAGTAQMVVAMILAIWLVVAHVWDGAVATAVGVALVMSVIVLWFVVPRYVPENPNGPDSDLRPARDEAARDSQ
jgi:hypothetical protein